MEIRGFSENSAKVAMNSAHENDKLMENLQRLSGQAEEIKKLNEWIANFSAQTNLLGLNAAIEAARAGEFGKGFGIVADEIRKLSLEVKQSSLAIAGQLTNMNNVANEALSLMQNLYSRTEEQAAMSQELASTVNSINQASSILSESVEKVL
jgi:heme-based aerotactic transducer